MIHLVKQESASQAFLRLRSQKIHPHFGGYLHLVSQSWAQNELSNITVDFKGFYDNYFEVAEHPLGYPYIRPFINTTPNSDNLWMNKNVAGSYAISSIRGTKPLARVVEVDQARKTYSLPDNHEELAYKYLLYERKVNFIDLAFFMLRDYGWCFSEVTSQTVSAILASVLTGNHSWRPSWSELGGNWSSRQISDAFVEVDGVHDALRPSPPTVTVNKIRQLTERDLVPKAKAPSTHPCLKSLEIDGLLSFGELTYFEFGKLNVLVGPNGSGKSNLIDCMRILKHASQDIQSIFSGSSIKRWLFAGKNSKPLGKLEAEVALPNTTSIVRHVLTLEEGPNDRAQVEELIEFVDSEETKGEPLFIGSMRVKPFILASAESDKRKRRSKRDLGPDEYNAMQSILSQKRDLSQFPEITKLQAIYYRWRIYSDWTFGRESKLRGVAPPGSDEILNESMDNLAVALGEIESSESHDQLTKLLQELKHAYSDFLTRPVHNGTIFEIIEKSLKSNIPAERLSDGTLRFLAMAAILLQSDPPPLICLEEPELGMHPDAIHMVAEMIVEASKRTQLIVSTHSEHLLSAMQDQFDVLFAFDSGSDGSMVQALTAEEYMSWRSDHTLGELWSSGEIGGVRY